MSQVRKVQTRVCRPLIGQEWELLPLHGYMIKSLTLCCWIWPRKTCHQNSEVSWMWSKVEGIQRKNQEAMCSSICLPFFRQKCPISIFFGTSTPWIRIQDISQKDKPENSKWSRCLSWWILSDIPKRQKKTPKKKHRALLKRKVFHVWKVRGTTNRDSSPVALSPYDCLRHLTYRPRSPPARNRPLDHVGFHGWVSPHHLDGDFLWSHFCFITRICHLQTPKKITWHYLHYPNCSMKKNLQMFQSQRTTTIRHPSCCWTPNTSLATA